MTAPIILVMPFLLKNNKAQPAIAPITHNMDSRLKNKFVKGPTNWFV